MKSESELLVKVKYIPHSAQCGDNSPFEEGPLNYLEVPQYFIEGLIRPYVIDASGDSMEPKIHHGDKLVVDYRSDAQDGDIVVVFYNGNMLVKRISYNLGPVTLISENSGKYDKVIINDEDSFEILGVVKWIISQPG